MIVYLDTSAFLKLYLEEAGSSLVEGLIDSAAAACSHLITYAEMRAGLARATRMLRVTDAERDYQKDRFEADWAALQVLAADESLVKRAGELAEAFGLRGYDSVHLAAAERLWRRVNDDFHFAAFDRRLVHAARVLGMTTLEQH